MNQVNCITAVTYRLVAQDATGQNNIQARPVEVEHVLIRFWSQRGHGYPKPEKLQVFGRRQFHIRGKQFSSAGGKQRKT